MLKFWQSLVVSIKQTWWLLPLGMLIGALGYILWDWSREDSIVDMLRSVFPQIMGVVITVSLLDWLNRKRDQRQQRIALQDRLKREAHSTVNSVAVQAINELREHGWLVGEHGLLKGANLSGANLAGANLRSANLAGANLWLANLACANLFGSNLSNANLAHADVANAIFAFANLEGVNFEHGNLAGGDFRYANLSDALMTGVNLEGANLKGANLCAATLDLARFDQYTILPFATRWTSRTEITRFTDSDHPEFWQPQWAQSKQKLWEVLAWQPENVAKERLTV